MYPLKLAIMWQAQLDEATGTVSPPPPRVNGTKVRKVLSDGSNPAEGADGAGMALQNRFSIT